MTKLYFAAMSRMDALRAFLLKRQEGASMVEYGLLVALIAIVCIAGLTTLGVNLNSMFDAIAGRISAVGPAATP